MRAFLALSLVLAASAARAEVIRIEVDDLAFVPAEIAAYVGDTVEWVNKDFIDHTATARGGGWDVLIPAESSGRLLLEQEGRIGYYCRFHPGMTGTVVVRR